jgi:hypothetical protein
MKDVYIIDSFSHHSFHEAFTAGFINTCAYIFNNIFYYSCKSTKNCVNGILKRADIEKDKIEFRNIFVVENENKYLLIFRYFISAIINIFYLIKVPKNTLIIYCYNNIFALPALNGLNKILGKKIVIICHGELEFLNEDWIESLGPLAKIIRKNVISFFWGKNVTIAKKLIFIVLGESILSNLKSILSSNIIKSIYAIDHPFVFDKCNYTSKPQNKLRLGTVGVVSKTKNINQFIYIARLFLPEVKAEKISFSVAGTVYYKKEELLDAYIDIPDWHGGFMDRAALGRRIQSLDYILFFYHSKMYKYLASGAVLDAINAEKPILALRNDYFEYLFSRFGPFGYLVDSIDDMEKLIREIITGKKIELFNFKDIKENLSPLAVSCQLRVVLNTSGLFYTEYDR